MPNTLASPALSPRLEGSLPSLGRICGVALQVSETQLSSYHHTLELDPILYFLKNWVLGVGSV